MDFNCNCAPIHLDGTAPGERPGQIQIPHLLFQTRLRLVLVAPWKDGEDEDLFIDFSPAERNMCSVSHAARLIDQGLTGSLLAAPKTQELGLPPVDDVASLNSGFHY